MTPGVDSAALDLHYASNGRVAGTLIVFPEAKLATEKIPDLLREIDEILLPEASVEHGNLTFVVVQGSVVGNFTAEANGDLKARSPFPTTGPNA